MSLSPPHRPVPPVSASPPSLPTFRPRAVAEEELEELKEEFRTRLGAADTTIQALKVRQGSHRARGDFPPSGPTIRTRAH